MPLKLADIAHPASTNIVNRWADGQERTQSNQATQIKELQTKVASLNKTTSASTSSTSSSVGGTIVVPGATVGPFSVITFSTTLPCSQTDVISWSFQGPGPGAVYVVGVGAAFLSGYWQIQVSTANTSGGGSATYGSYILNYKVT